MVQCARCNRALSATEASYGTFLCDGCFDKMPKHCKQCKSPIPAKDLRWGTGLCNRCYDMPLPKVTPSLPETCAGCKGTCKGGPYAAQGLCEKCFEKAMSAPPEVSPSEPIRVRELAYFLQTGTVPPANRTFRQIYGRIHAYRSLDSIPSGRILPQPRAVTFVVGADGLDTMIGKRGFDLMLSVGIPRSSVEYTLKHGAVYALVLFEVENDFPAVVPADWDGVKSVTKRFYPSVWEHLEKQIDALRQCSYKDAMQHGGADSVSPLIKTGLSPTEAYLASPGSVADARAWLYHELYCCDQFSGNGWTYDEKGNRGLREYFACNHKLSDIKNTAIVPIDVSLADSGARPPETWTPQRDNCVLVRLTPDSAEWKHVEQRVKVTLPQAKIHCVERVQNVLLYQKYMAEKELVAKRNGWEPPEVELFHGTGQASPEMVYLSDEGFDMRFCTSGMWGIAVYFAENASYSNSYAHHSTQGMKQFFLAQVTVGDTHQCQPDGSLRMPPVKSNNNGFIRRFDSVTGHTGGSRVFMIYTNGRAYPKYLITYRDF